MAIMCTQKKRERAWYLIARDQPTTVQSMGRVGVGYKINCASAVSQSEHAGNSVCTRIKNAETQC